MWKSILATRKLATRVYKLVPQRMSLSQDFPFDDIPDFVLLAKPSCSNLDQLLCQLALFLGFCAFSFKRMF